MFPTLDEALALLDGVAERHRLADNERVPAWRAVKLLYAYGVPEKDCEWIVWSIGKLGSENGFGPKLPYYLDLARSTLQREAANMCNRARYLGEPETLRERFGASWAANSEASSELYPTAPARVVRADERGLGIDVMRWDVTAGAAPWPMTNVRNLKLPQWKALAQVPANRCIVPLTEFCEWTPDKHQVGIGKPVKGEMWFSVVDQPVFAVAGFWRRVGAESYFAMVTCDPNELVAPIHPKAMITILHEADWPRWLNGSFDDVVALQQPYPAEKMTARGPVFPTRRNET
jgi:putative SOS response-associated peptidase YedK